MAKKSKLQQERAVIPAGNHGLGAKTVTSGESAPHVGKHPAASTSGAEPASIETAHELGRQQ